MRSFAIGVDLGATTVKAGTVDKKGKIINQIVVDSRAKKGPPAVIQQIHFAVQELLGRHKPTECSGIGVGAPGVVGAEGDGIVKYPPNFSDWTEVALGKAIRKFFPLPVFVENDANAAAIAEATYGAGAQYRDFVFVIWGSGVGGGIIINHRIFHGPQGGAGEIGHISIDYNGPACNCGNNGCIESYIGQRYLSQRTRELLQRISDESHRSKIAQLVDGDLNKIEPSIISMAAEQGDSIAAEILEEAGQLLGYALASAVNVLDIRIVIVGGGISAAPKFVFTAIESALKSRVLKPHKSAVKVVPASLGNTAGIIGAASLAMS